jgi:hypothetical protein
VDRYANWIATRTNTVATIVNRPGHYCGFRPHQPSSTDSFNRWHSADIKNLLKQEVFARGRLIYIRRVSFWGVFQASFKDLEHGSAMNKLGHNMPLSYLYFLAIMLNKVTKFLKL